MQRFCLDFAYSGTQWLQYLIYTVNLVGVPLFTFSLFGILYSVWHRDSRNKKSLFLIAYICLTYILYGSRAIAIQRYILPVVPAMVIFSGVLFGEYLNKTVKLLKIPVICFVIAYSFLYALSADLILLNDTRYKAEKWIKENIAKGSSIAFFSYPIYLPRFQDGYKIMYIQAIQDKSTDFDKFLVDFKKRRFDYLVLSELYDNTYISSDQYPERMLFYRKLLKGKLGYKIAADLKYKPILNPEVDFANPRILILKHNIE